MIFAYPRATVRAAEADLVALAQVEGDADFFMRSAAKALVAEVLAMLGERSHDLDPLVCALVGGGDNGGDALYAAAFLAERGLRVCALSFGRQVHEGAAIAARSAGIELVNASDLLDAGHALETNVQISAALDAPVWIDGILGTGIVGAPREPVATALRELESIRKVRGARVLAADVPSGGLSDEGEPLGIILRAERTVTMGALKSALVLPPASYAAGHVRVHDLGCELPDSPIRFVEDADIAQAVAIPGPLDHKYTRGVAGLVAGSNTYPGAGILAVAGAQAGGAGMVRLDAPRRVEDMVLVGAPGIVTKGGRIQAGLVGPGMDEDTTQECRELARFCIHSGLPLIVDAGALTLVPELRSSGMGGATVLTPHAGEAAHLLGALDEPRPRGWVEDHPVQAAQALAQLTSAYVLLKGASSILASPEGRLIAIPLGLGWTGVAGSGDVLAGVLTGLAASWRAKVEAGTPHGSFEDVIAAGALLHVRAGACAAREFGPRGAPIRAVDIAAAIPRVLGVLLGGANRLGCGGGILGE